MKIIKSTKILRAKEADNKIHIDCVVKACACCNATKTEYRFRVFEKLETSDLFVAYIEEYFETLNQAFDHMNEFLRAEYETSVYAE